MKIFKYRVWDNKLECMLPLVGFTLNNGRGRLFISPIGSKTYKIEDVVIMPETGFKDSIGKSIFDGDILSDFTETDEGIVKSYSQVFWSNEEGAWALDNSFGQDKGCSEPLANELRNFKFEISGNVCDNPDLIERKIEDK